MNDPSNEAAQADDIQEDEQEEEKSVVTDNVGEISVELNVDDLIAELEAERTKSPDDSAPRKKLEEILEERRIARDIQDMENFEIESTDVESLETDA